MSLKPGSRFGSLLTSSNASLAAGMHACPPCHPPLPAMGKIPPMCSSSGRPASLPSSRGEAIKQSKNIQNVTAPSLVISCWNVNVQNVITAFAFANTNRKSNKMAEQAGRTKYGNGRKWGETRRDEANRVESRRRNQSDRSSGVLCVRRIFMTRSVMFTANASNFYTLPLRWGIICHKKDSDFSSSFVQLSLCHLELCPSPIESLSKR